jgi:hypothetical protein
MTLSSPSRGFRRVTSEGLAPGTVAYYHNSFRKQEQELLKTMGIGKKNDSAVQDLQPFGGENSMIGSASAAISRESLTRSEARLTVASAPITHGQLLDRHILEASMGRRQPSQEEVGAFAAALMSSQGLPSPVRQESKTDAATSNVLAQAGLQGMDSQQLLLDAMLARQRQTDVTALQERGAAILAERLLLQQADQRRASATITSTLASARDDDYALQLAAFAANTPNRQQQHHRAPPQQNPFVPSLRPPLLPDIVPGLNSDPALALLRQQRLQASDFGTNISLLTGAGLPSNLNPFAVNVNMLQGVNLNPNILGNHPLPNVIANANAQGNRDLENLLRVLLQSRQRDTTIPGPEQRQGQGQGPAGGRGQGPPQL